MPPFQSQPRLEIRQSIVLSITRLSTTYTTSIGLSPSTITPSSSPTQTTVTPPPAVAASQPSGLSSGATAGIVLGSILGTFVLATLFYKCCIDGKSAAVCFPLMSRNWVYSLTNCSGHQPSPPSFPIQLSPSTVIPNIIPTLIPPLQLQTE
jgi:hypothetical protein